MEKKKTMKTALRAALTTNLHPAFFGLTCLLLTSLFLTARVMVDDWTVAEDGANASFYFPVSPNWLVVK
jgi:hypothetical protein